MGPKNGYTGKALLDLVYATVYCIRLTQDSLRLNYRLLDGCGAYP
jgi:hypothetical protein